MDFRDTYAPIMNHNDMLLKNKVSKNYGTRFNQDSRNITNKDISLLGQGINRWEPLFFDPQKNSIEPFQREGMNTYLSSIDNHVKSCGNQ